MLDEQFKNKLAIILLLRLKRNNTENLNKNFKHIKKVLSPFFWMIIAVIASIASIHHGISLSLECNDWTIFSRSGSLLVSIALVSVLIDHSKFYRSLYLNISDKNITKHSVFIDKVIRRKIKQILKEYKFQKSSNEIDYLVNIEGKLFAEYASILISKEFNKYSRRLELILAVLGTLIWGFGDLIGGFKCS